MDARDRAFLEDMYTFICLNRVAAVRALALGAYDTSELAVWSLAAIVTQVPVENLDAEALNQSRSTVVEQNGGGMVSGIMLTKLFVEMMTGYEDLGAFCFAIKERANSTEKGIARLSPGIFGRYLDSKTDHVRQYINWTRTLDIPNRPEILLDTLLNLPMLGALTPKLPAELRPEVTRYYSNLPRQLDDLFGQFIEVVKAAQMTNVVGLSGDDWKRDINILMRILRPGEQPQPEILLRAFQKLKHRFTVTPQLSAYDTGARAASPSSPSATAASAPAASGGMEYGRIPHEARYIRMFLQNTVSTAKAMRGLASMLLQLDDAGVAL